ncbi:hypothetical protein TNCT_53751 [Trichonephila clavata]|uniref:Uncharacterized protein n=1 Tax=Trichonephila clavata TaxID=2740835 RepID=A0A8X6KSJ5_TRICU|nr:hypothetical protein TNCT_53751 [Trichonephila clavata]
MVKLLQYGCPLAPNSFEKRTLRQCGDTPAYHIRLFSLFKFTYAEHHWEPGSQSYRSSYLEPVLRQPDISSQSRVKKRAS